MKSAASRVPEPKPASAARKAQEPEQHTHGDAIRARQCKCPMHRREQRWMFRQAIDGSCLKMKLAFGAAKAPCVRGAGYGLDDWIGQPGRQFGTAKRCDHQPLCRIAGFLLHDQATGRAVTFDDAKHWCAARLDHRRTIDGHGRCSHPPRDAA